MSLFSAFVRTSINICALPLAMAKDVIDMTKGETANNTHVQITKIKDEAED